MKRLTVLRHAKSSWAEPGIDDFNRPLNERGWKAARRMGKELKHRKLSFDFALASPAARVRETIDGLTETYGEPNFPIRFEPRIYLASAEALRELVSETRDEVDKLLLVGHSPAMERLAVELSHDDKHGLRARIAEKFPTAALATIELPVESWAEVEPGQGKVVELILPKELD
jgi:phosphohistidine phosphatase